jgi:hypothetical protein
VTTASGTQYRNVQSNGGYASSYLGPIHFGLGGNETASVEVTWPDGKKSTLPALRAGTIHEVRETP